MIPWPISGFVHDEMNLIVGSDVNPSVNIDVLRRALNHSFGQRIGNRDTRADEKPAAGCEASSPKIVFVKDPSLSLRPYDFWRQLL